MSPWLTPKRDSSGSGRYSDVIDGILWAKDRAHVINLSLAGTTSSKALCDAVASAARRTLVVAAAGNSGSSEPHYPAACDGVIAVGASGWAQSNYGPWVDITAPGVDVWTTFVGGHYGTGTGTSQTDVIIDETCGRMDTADDATFTITFTDDTTAGRELGQEAEVTVEADLHTLTGFFDSILGGVDLASEVHIRLEDDATWATRTKACP